MHFLPVPKKSDKFQKNYSDFENGIETILLKYMTDKILIEVGPNNGKNE